MQHEIWKVTLSALILASLGESQLRQTAANREMNSSVEFLVVSQQGKSLKGSLVSLLDANQRSVMDHCAGLSCVKLPVGKYSYVVTAPGVGFVRGDALLIYPNALVTVSSAWGDRGSVSFPGRVQDSRPRRATWIRAHAIVGNRNLDARVAEDGHFVLHGVLNDVYAVSVISADGTVLLSDSFVCCDGSRDGGIKLRSTAKAGGSSPQRLEVSDGFRPF